jgi:nitrate/nitrite-specific signal transduction histidine kinase
MLRCSKMGIEPSEDKINSVTQRIDEILKAISVQIQSGEVETKQTTYLKLSELNHFMQFSISRLKSMYPEIKISFDETVSILPSNASILLNRELCYQAIENAVENSKNAMANSLRIYLETDLKNALLCICDNGIGMKNVDEATRITRQASGMNIIQENMKLMNGKFEYLKNADNGITLKLTFCLSP